MENSVIHIYPANSLQQGFIYHYLNQPEDDAYRVQLLYDYRDDLAIDLYIKAWEYCILEYPILRTGFNWEEELIQVIYKQGDLSYEFHDLSSISNDQDRDNAIRSIQELDRKESFDLSSPTLLRLHIIKQSEDCYTIIKSEHHSISDGWSGAILLNKVHLYYCLLYTSPSPRDS